MIYLLDNIDYNILFYVLIILLIIVLIAIFYLVYTQHKEMVKILDNKKSEEQVIKSNKENIEIENTKTNFELPVINENSYLEIIEDKEDLQKTKAIELPIEKKIEPEEDYQNIELKQDDDFDLEMVSQKLEEHNNKHQSIASRYEEEQEELAIISYDELIKKKNEEDSSIDLPKIKEEFKENKSNNTDTKNYDREEEFLKELKSLKSILR